MFNMLKHQLSPSRVIINKHHHPISDTSTAPPRAGSAARRSHCFTAGVWASTGALRCYSSSTEAKIPSTCLSFPTKISCLPGENHAYTGERRAGSAAPRWKHSPGKAPAKTRHPQEQKKHLLLTNHSPTAWGWAGLLWRAQKHAQQGQPAGDGLWPLSALSEGGWAQSRRGDPLPALHWHWQPPQHQCWPKARCFTPKAINLLPPWLPKPSRVLVTSLKLWYRLVALSTFITYLREDFHP